MSTSHRPNGRNQPVYTFAGWPCPLIPSPAQLAGRLAHRQSVEVPGLAASGKSEEAGGGERRGQARLRPTCLAPTSGLSTTLAGCDAAYNGEAVAATASARAGPGRAFRRVLGRMRAS